MSFCEQPGLLPINVAIDAQLAHVNTVTEQEQIALNNALGRILACDIQSEIAVPLADNSAMDGYAFQLEDHGANLQVDLHKQPFKLIGKALAGHPFTGKVSSGECVRIMTGAVLPKGTNTVVMQEQAVQLSSEDIKAASPVLDASEECEWVSFQSEVQLGQNVRQQGEDIAKGATVLKKGTRLTAAHLALIASIGIGQVTVFRRVKVGVLATGDELKLAGEALAQGELYECNRVGLIAMLQRLGVAVKDYGILPDDYDSIKAAFVQADEECDWIISSGGVSVGEADFVRNVISEVGNVDFWKVAIKPGKPYAFGKLPSSVLSGLPGNPVSSFVTFLQLVVPALRHMAGESQAPKNMYFSATSDGNIRKHPARADYQRGTYYTNAQGELRVTPVPKQGSNIMTSFSQANCFIVLEQGRGNVQQDERVSVLPFDELLR